MQVTWVDFSLLFQAFALSLPPCTGYSFRLGFVHYTILPFLFTSSHLSLPLYARFTWWQTVACGMENFLNLMPWPVPQKWRFILEAIRTINETKILKTIRCRKHFNAATCMWKEKFFFQSVSQVYSLFLFPGTASSILKTRKGLQ